MRRVVDNRYTILEALGSGGEGEVFLARDEVLDRSVALKVLSRRYAGDEEFVERFRREAHSAAALSHPNIVSVHDLLEGDGNLCIVMEYVQGVTLAELIEREGPSRGAPPPTPYAPPAAWRLPTAAASSTGTSGPPTSCSPTSRKGTPATVSGKPWPTPWWADARS